MQIEDPGPEDLEEILDLQKLCYLSEAAIYDDDTIPPLTQTLSEIAGEFEKQRFFKMVEDGKIIASVRAYQCRDTCYIGKLIVHPDFQNRGIGKLMMHHVESEFAAARRYELFTGAKSERNLYLYRKLGYVPFKEQPVSWKFALVYLEKRNKLIF